MERADEAPEERENEGNISHNNSILNKEINVCGYKRTEIKICISQEATR